MFSWISVLASINYINSFTYNYSQQLPTFTNFEFKMIALLSGSVYASSVWKSMIQLKVCLRQSGNQFPKRKVSIV